MSHLKITKHARKMPKTRLVDGKINIVGAKTGRRSRAQRRALKFKQAEVVIAKFGGARELCRVVKDMCPDPKDHWNPSSIYRWTYPVEFGGTDGEIPINAIKTIIRAARYAGILLKMEDLYPEMGIEHLRR